MDEHLAAWQISEFTLGGLDEAGIAHAYRHVWECVTEWAGWPEFLKSRCW